MTSATRRRIAYSVAAAIVILAWRPLRAAIDSDALFFVAALALMVCLAAVAGKVSR